jgi:hypothetical protein
MRKWTRIVAIVAVLIGWAVIASRSESRQAPQPEPFLTKSGTLEQYEMLNAQAEQYRRESLRNEYSGSVLRTDNLVPGIDQETVDALAPLFREQAPLPADRVAHFAWLDQARNLVDLLGWQAILQTVDQRGDELWVELAIFPALEAPDTGSFGPLSNDHYIETYVVRDGQFIYQGGRAAPLVQREIRTEFDSGNFFVF